MSPARTLAYRTLIAVEKGGYADDFLASNSVGFEHRDAALAEEIVFGVLRHRSQLDHLIDLYRARGGRLDIEVRAVLRMGVYQLRYLDRIPAHAAVNDAVEQTRRARKSSAAGLVNAVLRKVTRDPVQWPSREVELCCPEWLLERWERQYGAGAAEQIARAQLLRPEAYIRVPEGSAPPPGAEATAIPGCYRVDRPGVGSRGAGGFRFQDIGSQSVVPLLDLRPGQTFLDLCAAPGNKTAQALETPLRAVACDVHPRRAAMLKPLDAGVVVLDATQPLPFARRFDRILVDAPCSGTGTLAHHPEIKWRLRSEDIAGLQRLQIAILRRACEALAPGGRLTYSTCSLEREENEDVVEAVAPGKFMISQRLPGRDPGDGFFAAVLQSQ